MAVAIQIEQHEPLVIDLSGNLLDELRLTETAATKRSKRVAGGWMSWILVSGLLTSATFWSSYDAKNAARDSAAHLAKVESELKSMPVVAVDPTFDPEFQSWSSIASDRNHELLVRLAIGFTAADAGTQITRIEAGWTPMAGYTLKGTLVVADINNAKNFVSSINSRYSPMQASLVSATQQNDKLGVEVNVVDANPPIPKAAPMGAPGKDPNGNEVPNAN